MGKKIAVILCALAMACSTYGCGNGPDEIKMPVTTEKSDVLHESTDIIQEMQNGEKNVPTLDPDFMDESFSREEFEERIEYTDEGMEHISSQADGMVENFEDAAGSVAEKQEGFSNSLKEQ